MVNVTCCGNQDRSELNPAYPNTPPPQTRNCYVKDGFNYDTCQSDGACEGHGGCAACIPNSHGGYCKFNENYYSSQGMKPKYTKLNVDELMKLSDSSYDSSHNTGRAFRDYQRMFTNRIRELQIMGRDPLPQRSTSTDPSPPPPPPRKPKTKDTSDTLFYVGIFISFLVFISSIVFILIQKKIIKI